MADDGLVWSSLARLNSATLADCGRVWSSLAESGRECSSLAKYDRMSVTDSGRVWQEMIESGSGSRISRATFRHRGRCCFRLVKRCQRVGVT